MARNLCVQCQRPINACICDFICDVNNEIPVLVLQHPSEVNQTKGTVSLLKRSLSHCQVLVGEDFSADEILNKMLTVNNGLLLYPSEKAQDISMMINKLSVSDIKQKKKKPPLLIIIDGTWKKAYKMFMLSKNLHALAQVCLPNYLANSGQYLIRKVAKESALSSLEATCYALALLEGQLKTNFSATDNQHDKSCFIDCGNYQPLLNKFAQFNQFQLSFRK